MSSSILGKRSGSGVTVAATDTDVMRGSRDPVLHEIEAKRTRGSRHANAVPNRIRATISVNREQVLSYPDAPLRAVGTVRG